MAKADWQTLAGERSPGPAELYGWTRAAWYCWDPDGEHCSLFLARYRGDRWPYAEAQYKHRRKWVTQDWWQVVPAHRRITRAQAERRGIPLLAEGVHVRDPHRDACARCLLTGQAAWSLKRYGAQLPLCPA